MGASVVGLCEDTHHLNHLKVHLREKCVESMLGGSVVFSDAALTERSKELFKKSKENQKEKEKEPEKADPEEKEKDKEKERAKHKEKNKNKENQQETPLETTPKKREE